MIPFWRRPRGMMSVYRGALSGLRISAVDGTAFIDNASALTTYADGYHEISIYDSNGYELKGVLKAAGTGETLGSELITNGTFDSNTTGWSTGNSALLSSVAGGESGNALQVRENGAANPYTSKGMSVTAGGLYKNSFSVKSGTSSTYRAYITGDNLVVGTKVDKTSTGSWTTPTPLYGTAIGTGETWMVLGLITTLGSGQTHLFDNASLKQALTPSSSGATIVSAKGGTTYNFTSKHASFTYNAASYKVVVRRLSGGSVAPPPDGILTESGGSFLSELGDRILKE